MSTPTGIPREKCEIGRCPACLVLGSQRRPIRSVETVVDPLLDQIDFAASRAILRVTREAPTHGIASRRVRHRDGNSQRRALPTLCGRLSRVASSSARPDADARYVSASWLSDGTRNGTQCVSAARVRMIPGERLPVRLSRRSARQLRLFQHGSASQHFLRRGRTEGGTPPFAPHGFRGCPPSAQETLLRADRVLCGHAGLPARIFPISPPGDEKGACWSPSPASRHRTWKRRYPVSEPLGSSCIPWRANR